LKFFKSYLIAAFEFTVLAGFLLDGVVGQMDVLIGAVLHAELETGSSYISCWVEVG
jgi:hypothetical protein